MSFREASAREAAAREVAAQKRSELIVNRIHKAIVEAVATGDPSDQTLKELTFEIKEVLLAVSSCSCGGVSPQ